MAVITKCDHVLGVRHWYQYYPLCVPRIEVFRVVGHDRNTGLYYFRSVKEKAIIAKSFYQLNTNGFHPFVIDFKRMQESMKGGGTHADI